MDTKTYAVVDLETTGHSSVKGDRIIQIAIILIENGKIGEKYVRFVNPGQKIPAFIRQLTNIDDQDVQDAPYFETIAAEVRNILEGTVFVAHNTDFDLPFLQSEFRRCQIAEWTGSQIDTVELAKIIFPSAPSYRLQDIAEELGIPLPSAHRADDDAEATSKLLLKCNEKLNTLPEETLNLLHRRSFKLKSDLSSLFYEAVKKARLTRRQKDYSIFRGIPYRTVNQSKGVFGKEIQYPKDDKVKIDWLKKVFPQFEEREAQSRFMDVVWQTLTEQSEAAAEVPTGIGKTMAYLLPAAIRSIETGKPVVISTYTNHLVDKILQDELKKVDAILDLNLTATVLKGREQYISLRKFEELLTISEQSYDETFTIMQILVWLTETETGDVEELNVSGGGQLFVDRIRKRFTKMTVEEQAADYYSRHIQQCRHSNFIITNHAMLVADLNRKESLFENLSGVVVDEAHQFVQTASQIDETVFSFTNWKYVMGQVGTDVEGQLLYEVFSLLRKIGEPVSVKKEQLFDAFARFTTHFDYAAGVLAHYEPQSGRRQQSNRKIYSLNEIRQMRPHFEKVATAMSVYLDEAERITKALRIHKAQMSKNDLAILSEWIYWTREIQMKAGEWVTLFLDEDDQQYTVWMEKDQRSLPGSLKVIKRPLDSALVIRKFVNRLQQEKTGIVWTSGTLLVTDHPRYIPMQLGLEDCVPLHVYDAPAHFYEGAEIYIVNDMPDIQQVSQTDYIEAVTDAVIQTVMATGGRLFVLFTSNDMLKKTYELIVESEQLEEYALFAQGITSGSRMKLLKSFNQYNHSVLFGTSSFWEGVDVPGDALSAVIVVRLPFTSPEEPVFKAKAERLNAQGLNPFGEYALPEAIMRMRQGFGRLIRSSADRGSFIILDRRIETKSYGARFLESLPSVPVKKVALEVMVNELENCYNRKG